MKKLKLFICGMLVGLTTLSICMASVPSKSFSDTRVSDDTVISQKLSEIRVARELEQNFDGDVQRLSKIEGRYRENLPALKSNRVTAPQQRIASQKYRYSGSKQPQS